MIPSRAKSFAPLGAIALLGLFAVGMKATNVYGRTPADAVPTRTLPTFKEAVKNAKPAEADRCAHNDNSQRRCKSRPTALFNNVKENGAELAQQFSDIDYEPSSMPITGSNKDTVQVAIPKASVGVWVRDLGWLLPNHAVVLARVTGKLVNGGFPRFMISPDVRRLLSLADTFYVVMNDYKVGLTDPDAVKEGYRVSEWKLYGVSVRQQPGGASTRHLVDLNRKGQLHLCAGQHMNRNAKADFLSCGSAHSWAMLNENAAVAAIVKGAGRLTLQSMYRDYRDSVLHSSPTTSGGQDPQALLRAIKLINQQFIAILPKNDEVQLLFTKATVVGWEDPIWARCAVGCCTTELL